MIFASQGSERNGGWYGVAREEGKEENRGRGGTAREEGKEETGDGEG